ncbi:MAG: Fic family protein [Candidatus Bathyarchaeota archaeon]|nr:Fic family protein [Candidatus Bathyarchaeota archaeon]
MNVMNEKMYNRTLQKKLKLDRNRPLSEATLCRLRQNMEIEYTYNSNAIEGNRLTLRETQLVIREGITIGGRSIQEHLEAKNHPKAIEYIEELAKQKDMDRTLVERHIRKIHELIFSGSEENAGNYRNCQVYIEGCDQMPPPACEIPELMKELVGWLNANMEELRPIELAAVFHHRLVSIHPFDDGNGRVARLVTNLLLMSHGYPIMVVRRVDRKKYYSTLQKADQGNLKPFVNFIARCVEQSLDIYLSAIEPGTKKNQFLTLAEAAKLTPYNKGYLGLLARRGLIAATKIGRNWHITQEALEQYMKNTHSKKRGKSTNIEKQ